ncbi:LamG-like jellyroll fold domain-containing protein [Adhaeribacter soli]|uniref:T9SS type A sorting domain-containing protein n=1 Tax=Adhaeribacter soli TaxID=2607655 RepID=A0A5N1IKQ9_9BACT|nr:LamG-like jellyroll fold domain-containing protein [Adhaeribacter soli]KAA9325979.1 T9SS type A sorting domain-containing protein [Adhaeribacter soli]
MMYHYLRFKRTFRLHYVLLLVLFCLIFTAGFSQSVPVKIWDIGLGGSADEQLNSIAPTNDGGCIMGGYSKSDISGDKTEATRGNNDFWIVKLDLQGNKQWEKTYGGSGADYLASLQQISDGGYILGGYSSSGISGDKSQASKGGLDFWVLKLDANGNKLWDKTFGGDLTDALRKIVQTSDGGYLLAGDSDSGISGDKTQASKGDKDFWVIKLDAGGNKQWDKSYGGSSIEYLYDLELTTDGGFVIGGSSDSGISSDKSGASKGGTDYWIIKLTAVGVKQWDKAYGGSLNDNFSSMELTSDGGYILAGYSNSGISGDKSEAGWGSNDYWIVKTDANGNKQWDKTFGGTDSEIAEDIIQTADGNFLLAGSSMSGISGNKTTASRGSMDIWLIKLDANGNKLWERPTGTNNYDFGGNLVEALDGSYLLGANSYGGRNGDKSTTSRGGFDYWALKMTNGSLPAVSGVSPNVSPANCQVTINGSNFAGATAVNFHGVSTTTFTVSTDGKSILATIPNNATSGTIGVTTPQGTTFSSASLIVVRPTITPAGATTFCAGGSVQLTATSNYTQNGSAVNFDGNGNYVNVPDFSFNSNGGPVTVEFWTKASAATTGSRSIFSITTADGLRFQAHVPGSGNTLHFDYGNLSGSGRISAPYTAYLDQWTHVALVSGGKNGTWKAIYINGVLVNSATVSDGADTRSRTGLTIGKWDALYHKGAVDEFRIWNKIRTQAEIQADMYETYAGAQSGLLGYWTFDETYGSVTADISGRNAAGTFVQGTSTGLPAWITPAWLAPTYTWSPATGLNTTSGAVVTALPGTTTTYSVTAAYPASCSVTETQTITVNPLPIISSFSPASAGPGMSVTLTGTNLNTLSEVKFNGTNAASYTILSATQVWAEVPATATSGKISVVTAAGCSATSSSDFTFVPTPEVYTFFPVAAKAGCTITINGKNLSGALAVRINNSSATNVTVNAAGTQITATIPASATSGPVTVTTAGGASNSPGQFTLVTAPSITAAGTTTFCAGGSVNLTATGNQNLAGTALQTDGLGNHVNVPDFNFNANGGAVTVEFWVKTNTADVKASSIFSFTTADGLRFQAHAPWTDKMLHWDYGTTSNGRVSVNFTPYLDKWTHVALVSAGKGGNWKAIYLNGNLAASGTVSDGASTLGATGMMIGRWNGNYHKGSIDEFRVWNKVRTQSEIQADMNRAISGSSSGLVGYWRFDETSGTTAYDGTANNFHGTLTAGSSAAVPARITSEATIEAAAYSWSWSGGTAAGETLTAAPASTTTYTLTANYGGSCNSTATQTITINPQPALTSFTPTSAGPGMTVTLTGTNLSTVNSVKFNGVNEASYTVISGTQITAVVPATATTGKISVATSFGCSALSNSDFTFVPAPDISSFTPGTAPTGCAVVITGNDFSGATSVTFNGTAAASFTVNSATQLTATIPAGASTGKISITTAGGTAVSSTDFTVATALVISPAGPVNLCPGSTVTLTVTGAVNPVWSNGQTGNSITVNSAGNYYVTSSYGSGCSRVSNTVTVNAYQAAVPTVTASGSTDFCAGASVTLTAPAGMSSYRWSNGQTTQSLVVSTAGNYTVTVTYPNGCQATSAGIPVKVIMPPVVTIDKSGPVSICQGSSVTLTASAIAPGFVVGSTGFSGTVYALHVDSDGKVLAGGTITSYKGVSRRGIARINVNGSLDTDFNPGTGFANSSLPTHYVYAIAVQADKKILVGGEFNSYNGKSCNNLVRLNPDGTIDNTFAIGMGVNGAVHAIVVQPDGKIVLGGSFLQVNGVAANRIIRLTSTGALDAGFTPGSGFSGGVRTLALQPDGKIVAGGLFATFNGTSRNNIARLNSDGTVDAGFNPGSGFNNTVLSVGVLPEGKVVASGNFTLFNGSTVNYLARLKDDGTLDPDFSTGTGFNSPVPALAVQPDGKIVAGGYFTTYNGSAQTRIVRLNYNGTPDNTFVTGAGFNGVVMSLALQPDGKIVTGGDFSTYKGISSSRISRLTETGALDNTDVSVSRTILWSNGQTGNSISVSSSGNYAASVCSGASAATTVTVNQSGTWLGAVSTDWSTAANWCGGVPTSTTNVVIPAGAPRMPVISGSFNYWAAQDLKIENGAVLTLSDGMLTVSGNLNCEGTLNLVPGVQDCFLQLMKNFTCPGTFNHTGGYIEFTSMDAYDVPALTYHNLKLHGNRALLGNTVVKNLLILSRNVNTNGFNFSLRGDLQLEGPVSGAGKIILEQGSKTHNITAFYPELPNVEINDSYGAKLQSNLTVTGNLQMTQGVFDLNNFNLTLNGTISGESNASYLKGTLIKTVAINGSGQHDFGNIGLEFDNVGGGNWGNVKVSRITGSFVKNATDQTKKSISRRWKIEPDVQAGTPVNLSLKWLSADNNGLVFPGNEAQVWKSEDNGQKWFAADVLKPIGSTGDWHTMTVQTRSFSFWTIADQNNPLPVSWLYFKGNATDKGNVLHWATATEENSQAFVIERSANGRDFEPIDKVQAAGNSYQQRNYTFTDLNATVFAEKVLYYRLKQTDLDGSFSYSQVVAIKRGDLKVLEPSVWPNPFTNELRVSLPEVALNAEIMLTTLTGQVIYRTAVAPDISGEIRLENLRKVKPGLYLLQVRQGSKRSVFKVTRQ